MRTKIVKLILIFFQIGVFFGCDKPIELLPEEAPIIRFLDSDQQTESWLFSEEIVQKPGVLRKPSEFLTVGLNQNWQRALIVHSTTPKSISQTITTDGYLEFSCMAGIYNSPAFDGLADLHVTIKSAKETIQKVEQLPVTSSPVIRWRMVRIPLMGIRGEVEFSFSMTIDLEKKNASEVSVFVATPMFIPEKTEEKPNVIVWAFDSLRSDDLGCYGSPNGHSPTIDQLSRKGTLFSQSLSTSSWTVPGVRNMLTGMITQKYVHENALLKTFKDFEFPSVQAEFAKAGYMTICISSNHLLCPDQGFEKGFDILDTFASRNWSKSSTEQIFYQVRELVTQYSDRPLFVYIHAMDPHDPYLPLEPFNVFCNPPKDNQVRPDLWDKESGKYNRSPLKDNLCPLKPIEIEYLRSNYRGEIRQMDSCFFAVLSMLESIDSFPDTYLVVTGDHGEEFGEHGFYQHGATLFEAVSTVPMIFYNPGKFPVDSIVPGWALNMDIPPTLLHAVGLEPNPLFEGMNLFAPGQRYPTDRKILTVSRSYDKPEHSIMQKRAIRANTDKLIWGSDNIIRKYDLEYYPDESVFTEYPDFSAYFEQITDKDHQALGLSLQEFVQQTTEFGDVGYVSPKWESQLRELGYIE